MGRKIWESGDFCVAGGVGRPDYRGVKKYREVTVSATSGRALQTVYLKKPLVVCQEALTLGSRCRGTFSLAGLFLPFYIAVSCFGVGLRGLERSQKFASGELP
jgi:hypothetical protein